MKMEEIKRIKDPTKFLLDTGLLFHINVDILHPLGLAMEIHDDYKGDKTSLIGLWDYRDDPEGIIYDDYTFIKGLNKWCNWYEKFGRKKQMERYRALGYIIQGEDPKKKDWTSEVR